MAHSRTTRDDPATRPVEAPQAAAAVPRLPRSGSKLATVVDLLESAGGATIAEMMTATGWQQHTVRGALAGSITKKLGHTLSSEKVEGRGRVYRIAVRQT